MTTRRDTPRVDLERVANFGTQPLGSTLQIDWENVKADIGGYAKMITGLVITATVAFTGDAVAMASAMPAARVLDFIESLKLAIGPHMLIHSLGGHRLFHDARRVMGGSSALAGFGWSDIADATASGTRDVTLHIPFTPGLLHDDAQLDGAIPAAALRRTDLELKLALSGFGGFPGVTLDSVTNLKVYAAVRASHKLIVPTHWQIRAIVDARAEGVLTPPAGHLYYLDIFDTVRAGVYETDAADYSNAQFTIGSERLPTYTDPTVPAFLQNLARERDGGLVDQLDPSAPEFYPIVRSLMRGGLATKQPTGPVAFKYDAGHHESTTYQYRTRGTRHDGWRKTMFERLGVSENDVGIALQAAGGGHVPAILRPHLAESVVWRDMAGRWPAVAEQNAHKFSIAL